jgi:signal transduction histidine kinase/CheY-like chemotaxis protein
MEDLLPGISVGHPFWEMWEPLSAKEQISAFHRAIEARKREEIVVERGERWFQVAVDAVPGENGATGGAIYTIEEITSRKRLEDQFREAQKYESIGQLAGGVAHDFNNLLTAILGNASLVLSDLSPQNPMRARVEEILKASDRAAHLTRQLLAYSGRGHFVMRHSDLSEVVRDIEELLRASLPHTVQLRFELPAGLPEVNADRSQMQQLVMNLAINAGEAIGQAQGVVWIRTGGQENRVWLEVRDTGPGIAAEAKAHLFDPFFTTKFMGRGLGLAAVAGIVRGHGGEIEVYNAPEGGAVFRVLLPGIPPAVPATTGKKLILVVDDEELVRRVAQAALEIRGYRVLLAENGLEAVEAVRERKSEIAAVLLDLTMPVMSGEEAMEHIGRLAPGLKVVASSGYSEEEAARRFAGTTLAGFLQKPYTSRELAQKLESVLK